MNEGGFGLKKQGFMGVLQDFAASRGVRPEDISIKTEVGQTAGDVYKFLDGKGVVAFKDLRAALENKGSFFPAALGWLLREDKIEMTLSKTGIMIRLK